MVLATLEEEFVPPIAEVKGRQGFVPLSFFFSVHYVAASTQIQLCGHFHSHNVIEEQ